MLIIFLVGGQCPPQPHYPNPQQRKGSAALFFHWLPLANTPFLRNSAQGHPYNAVGGK